MSKQPLEEGRAPLDIDLDSVATTTRPKPKLTKAEMDAAGANAGFITPGQKADDDTAATSPAPTQPRTKKKAAAKARSERPWRRTGRTFPVNTNIKPESNEKLMTLVTTLSEREGRPVSKAEVLERALSDLHTKETKQTT